MKVVVFLAVLLAVAFASDEALRVQFGEFMVKYRKSYVHHEVETRFINFKASVARVEALQGTSAQFGITKFSDMTEEEFRSTILMATVPVKTSKAPVIGAAAPDASIPATYDWREHNAVTPVKDQGQCGSCWAFSATEAIESAWILKGHATTSTVDLAPQQIVDCDTIGGVQGCNGGETESAYEYIAQAGGQEPQKDYPYTGVNGKCKFNAADVDAKISTYSSIAKDETTLPTNLVNIGPLSICLDAAHWQDYQRGVMTKMECCPLLGVCSLDHCVQLVGYNNTAATPYWVVRNSWNTDWGVDGYIWLEKGTNTCGMLNDITWPTVM